MSLVKDSATSPARVKQEKGAVKLEPKGIKRDPDSGPSRQPMAMVIDSSVRRPWQVFRDWLELVSDAQGRDTDILTLGCVQWWGPQGMR